MAPGAIAVLQLNLGNKGERGSAHLEGGPARRPLVVHVGGLGDEGDVHLGGHCRLGGVPAYAHDVGSPDTHMVLGVLLQSGDVASVAHVAVLVARAGGGTVAAVLNVILCLGEAAVEALVPGQCDIVVSGGHGADIGGGLGLALGLEADLGLLGANVIPSTTGVVAIALLVNSKDSKGGLVDVPGQSSPVYGIVHPVTLKRAALEGPLEGGLWEGLDTAGYEGVLPQVVGNLVVPVDDNGRMLDPQEHLGLR